MTEHVYTVGHIFSGIGGKGLGAASAVAVFGDASATFRTLGGIDFDPLACKDFEMLVGAPALCADVHQLEPADLIAFFGTRAPDVIMMSPPCKGFSGLLSAKRAAEPKYQRMNTLMERGIFLVTSTWNPPPKLIFVENVPRIASRGKDTIRRCLAMGAAAGYAVAQGTHDCGELGGLAQHRRRYFQLWRHREQVPQFVGDDDLGQCTCQWSPGRGDPFRGSTRCEQDADHEPAVCPGCCADRDGDCVCWQQDVTP